MTTDTGADLRRRYLRSLAVFFLGGLAILLALLITQWQWLAVLFFAHLVVCGLLLGGLKCPRCGQPVFWRPLVPGSRILGYSSPVIPQRCLRCGFPLMAGTGNAGRAATAEEGPPLRTTRRIVVGVMLGGFAAQGIAADIYSGSYPGWLLVTAPIAWGLVCGAVLVRLARLKADERKVK